MAEHAKSLEGKVAVVTGAGRGIGKAIALGYAREGASVCCAARTQAEIDATLREIEGGGGRGLAVQTDVTQLDSVQLMFKATADAFGGVDILVANAGGNIGNGLVEKSDPAVWLATLDVNLTGVYYCARTAIPYLRERGAGKIIVTGSGIGYRGHPGNSAYACSKAGLSMFSRVLAQEVWEHNISVNELIPGPVVTERSRHGGSAPVGSASGIESEWVKGPEDVVPLALFLATQPDKGPTAQSFSLMRRDN
jgi:3-oxoacyl-[acyl-carrier protein] reductase